MGVPYENPPVTSDPISGGSHGIVEVDYPTRCTISAIKVVQASGTAVLFDVELFNHDPDVSDDGTPLLNYAVCNKKTASVAGRLLYFADEATGGHGYDFFNQDAPDATRFRTNMRKLYLRISPQGTGSKTFTVTITCSQSVGGD